MPWQDQLKGDSLSWLLEPASPEVRYLALRDLLDRPDTDLDLRSACSEAHQTGPIARILSHMDPSGYWSGPGPGYLPKYRSTVWSLILLAQLGASVDEDVRIGQACRYVVAHTLTPGGQFSMTNGPGGTIDCLQGNLCWALLELGCDDPRLNKAFDWMARSQTGEGIATADDRRAPERYYSGKCGPNFACGANNRLSCAWGAVKVMLALGRLPENRQTPATRQAAQLGVDFLLGVDPATAAYPTGYSDRPSGNWWKFGFPLFYITDLLQAAEALAALGYGSDPRLANLVTLILDKQDAGGRWALEFDYAGKTRVEFGPKKQPSKWVTLRALRVLKAIDSPSRRPAQEQIQ